MKILSFPINYDAYFALRKFNTMLIITFLNHEIIIFLFRKSKTYSSIQSSFIRDISKEEKNLKEQKIFVIPEIINLLLDFISPITVLFFQNRSKNVQTLSVIDKKNYIYA